MAADSLNSLLVAKPIAPNNMPNLSIDQVIASLTPDQIKAFKAMQTGKDASLIFKNAKQPNTNLLQLLFARGNHRTFKDKPSII